jgi:DNA-directed RNA polymerase subunit RPC12/RpoP/transcriptional regulator NrdR family protein
MLTQIIKEEIRMRFDGFRKRDGVVVSFQREKIRSAISKASDASFYPIGIVTDRMIDEIENNLEKIVTKVDGKLIPSLEEVQTVVVNYLEKTDYHPIADAYRKYKASRDKARKKIFVKNKNRTNVNVTDSSLLLVNDSQYVTSLWDRQRIVTELQLNTELEDEEIISVAKIAENRIIELGINIVGTTFIRELINNILLERGHHERIEDLSSYTVSSEFIQSLMRTKSDENSNVISNNPEAVSLNISGLVLKEWALNNVFDREVADAHRAGRIHLHDLDFPHRLYSYPENENILIKTPENKILSVSFKHLFLMLSDKIKKDDKGCEIKYPKGYKIWDNGNWISLKRVLRHPKENRKFITFTTKDGRSITTTTDHPIILSNKQKLNCKYCGSLNFIKNGSRKGNSRSYKCKDCNKQFRGPISLADNKLYIKQASDCSIGDILISSSQLPKIKKTKNISDNLAYFLGLYLAEGSCDIGRKTIQIAGNLSNPLQFSICRSCFYAKGPSSPTHSSKSGFIYL